MEYQLEYVVWRDTVEEQAGWHTYTDMRKLKTAICDEIGWVLQENKDELKLMASMIRKDKEGGRTIVIYKSSIIHRLTIPLKLYSNESKKELD
tara:strand:+ start:9975 stop:10253 length:279 start_codon:yes stop_codon:yes gene_type:complete